MTPLPSRHWQGIQILRAVAASAVLGHHALLQLRASGLWTWAPDTLAARFVEWLSSGVDLFFVISGFVLVQASRNLPPTAHAAGRFLLRRLARVLPLWWMALMAMILLQVALALKNGQGILAHFGSDPTLVVSSFLLLPLQTGAAGPFPILPVGWTLSFEFVFYGLFAASLALPRRVLPVLLALAFGLFHWVGPYAATAPLRWFFGSLLWWEFWLGVLLGLGFAKGWRPVRALSIGLLILGAGAGLSSLFPQCAGLPDLWTRGFPAALFLAGVCGLESRVQDVRLPRLGLAMGDASYALYLWHPLWIGGPLAFLFKGGVLGMPLALALCIVLPWIFALAFFRFVEAPWLRILRGK